MAKNYIARIQGTKEPLPENVQGRLRIISNIHWIVFPRDYAESVI